MTQAGRIEVPAAACTKTGGLGGKLPGTGQGHAVAAAYSKPCAYAATATPSRADPHILYHAVSHGRRNASRPESAIGHGSV